MASIGNNNELERPWISTAQAGPLGRPVSPLCQFGGKPELTGPCHRGHLPYPHGSWLVLPGRETGLEE